MTAPPEPVQIVVAPQPVPEQPQFIAPVETHAPEPVQPTSAPPPPQAEPEQTQAEEITVEAPTEPDKETEEEEQAPTFWQKGEERLKMLVVIGVPLLCWLCLC